MRQKCERYAIVYLFVTAGGVGESEIPSWRRESWRRFYAGEETAGGTETTSGRAEKTDGGTGKISGTESQDDRGEGEDAPKSRPGAKEEKSENGPTGAAITEGDCILAVIEMFQFSS